MRPSDIPQIRTLSEQIYGEGSGWAARQLESHLEVFPGGQLVAVRPTESGDRVLGMAASLIVLWDDYELTDSWRDFTAAGMFTNHDPARGRTLYGAEVMTDPTERGRGIGSALYWHGSDWSNGFGLRRIRAGARLPWLSPRCCDDVRDRVCRRCGRWPTRVYPTLSVQLRRGFTVIGVVAG